MSTAARLVTACLSFDREVSAAACARWLSLGAEEQRVVLDFADRAGVTLHLWRLAQQRQRFERLRHASEYAERRKKNEIRLEMRRRGTAEKIDLFHRAGLRVAVLKGFLLAPDFVADAAHRVQYDLDFLLPPGDARAAFDLLKSLGYRAGREDPGGPALHLPMLVPADAHLWTFKGDYFDPGMPAPIELHDHLWPAEYERIEVELNPDPMSRVVQSGGLPALHDLDRLAACLLHVFRHVLRGNLRLSHLYEVACFLDYHRSDEQFWRRWTASGSVSLRCVGTATLALAQRVFRCQWPSALESETGLLPAQARTWIERFGEAVVDPDRAEKQQIFLHLVFVHGWRDRLVILQRRLVPLRLPPPESVAPPASPVERLRRRLRRTALLFRRAWFHLRALSNFLLALREWRR